MKDSSPDVVRNSLSGVDLVTIPVDEYAHFLEYKKRLSEASLGLQAFAKASRSPIERDPEVATFLTERLGKMHVDKMLSECLERYGWKRTPSRSALYAFWKRLRERALKSF